MEKVIIGYGGFARELKAAMGIDEIKFFVDENYLEANKFVYSISDLDIEKHIAIIAIGDPILREEIYNRLPKGLQFFTYIDPRAIILSNNCRIGDGTIICAGSILTDCVEIGMHTLINLNVTIGHDTSIGNYCTISPGVNISGNCTIEKSCYLGTNSSVREGIHICSFTIIGMNGAVVKNVSECGTYIGVPAVLKK